MPAPPLPLGLDQLEALAMSHNPTLAQASARVSSMHGNWVQQGLYPNPRLAYKADEIGDDNRAGFQGFSVAQEIVTKGKLGLAQNVASQQVQQAQQEYAAQEFRVRNDVKLRFYEVLLAQRALELNQEMEQISGVAVDATNNLFQANQVGRTDVLQARVENDTVQLQTVKSRNAHESAWRRLATVIGMPDLPPQPLSGDLRQDIVETTWDAAWGRLFSSSPELAAAQAKVCAAQWAVRKACADRCPNWDVESGYSHDNATGFDTGGITVTVPVPLFNRNQGAIRQANADLQVGTSRGRSGGARFTHPASGDVRALRELPGICESLRAPYPAQRQGIGRVWRLRATGQGKPTTRRCCLRSGPICKRKSLISIRCGNCAKRRY